MNLFSPILGYIENIRSQENKVSALKEPVSVGREKPKKQQWTARWQIENGAKTIRYETGQLGKGAKGARGKKGSCRMWDLP